MADKHSPPWQRFLLLHTTILAVLMLGAGVQAAQRCSSPKCSGQCRELCNAKTMMTAFSKAFQLKPEDDFDAIAAQLFTPDVFMAVTPISSFEGRRLAMEYLLTFSRQSAPVPAVANLVDLRYRQVQVSTTAATLVVDLTLQNPAGPRYKSVLRGITMLAFNNVSLITHMTLDFPQWTEAYKALNSRQTATPFIINLSKQLLCTTHENYCNGTRKDNATVSNRQYASGKACLAFQDTIPFGVETFEERMAGNTVMCRIFHARYVDLDPDIHCPHIGINGGGKCVDEPLPYLVSYQDQHIPDGVFNSVSPAVSKFLASKSK